MIADLYSSLAVSPNNLRSQLAVESEMVIGLDRLKQPEPLVPRTVYKPRLDEVTTIELPVLPGNKFPFRNQA